ncbi:type II secretion system protein [bacterium]|nr:type II secretion system protein [bacterium]MBQ9246920.1 type II secretion system protein [bacterium]
MDLMKYFEAKITLPQWGKWHEVPQGNHPVGKSNETPRLLRSAGFTLAEGLITIGIIGVISALTIPSLIQKYQEKRTINQLKQTYSILSHAIKMAIADEGDIDGWCSINESTYSQDYLDCSDKMGDLLSRYIKNIQKCKGVNSPVACFATDYDTRHNSNWIAQVWKYPQYRLINGASLSIQAYNGDSLSRYWCKTDVNIKEGSSEVGIYGNRAYMMNCATIYVDINGFSKPNTDGKDLFAFQVYNNGIVPLGRKNVHSIIGFETCNGKRTGAAGSCTAWVLENNNMDYLHCNDLSWEGKHKCK